MVSVHPLKINAIFITISWTNCEKYGYSNFSTTSPRHFSRISPIAKTRQAFQPLLVSGVQHFHNHLGVDGTRSPMKIENMSWSGSPTESWYNKNITRKFRHNQLWLLGEVLWSALQRSIYIYTCIQIYYSLLGIFKLNKESHMNNHRELMRVCWVRPPSSHWFCLTESPTAGCPNCTICPSTGWTPIGWGFCKAKPVRGGGSDPADPHQLPMK